MKHMNFGKALNVVSWVGGLITTTSVLAQSQGGYGPGSGMMGGSGAGWLGGYGGMGLPILLVIVVAGLVAWFVSQKKK